MTVVNDNWATSNVICFQNSVNDMFVGGAIVRQTSVKISNLIAES